MKLQVRKLCLKEIGLVHVKISILLKNNLVIFLCETKKTLKKQLHFSSKSNIITYPLLIFPSFISHIDEENITDDDEDVNDQYHRYSYIPEVDDTTSEENLEEQLGARPKINTKSDTIDIRHKIASWYDEASDEIERDLSLDLSVLEEDEELMMPGGRHRYVIKKEIRKNS